MSSRNPIRSLLTLLLATAIATAQDGAEPKVPDQPDPAVDEAVTRVEAAWKDRRGAQDGEVVAGLRQLAERAATPLFPDDRRAILEVATLVLTKGKLREVDARQPYEAAADVLARFGEDGAKVLRHVYDRKVFPRKPEWEPMRAKLVEAIGATRADGVVPFLLEVITRTGENQVLKSAGIALAAWSDADGEVRKQIVDKLSSRLTSFEALADQNAVNTEAQLNLEAEAAKKSVEVLRGPWTATMSKLTGEEFAKGLEWSKWYRDNRRREWPPRPKD